MGRIGGLVLAAQRGPDYYRTIRAGKHGGPFSVYGDSPAARRLRAMDVAARRRLSDAEWLDLMEKRQRQLGLPAGSLTKTRRARERREA